MPQEIPLEASEELVFTPDCLKDVENAPAFVLRSPTPRDKRHIAVLSEEEGLERFDPEDLRAEVLHGLKKLWSEEDYTDHAPRLQAYWEAMDSFELQRRDDPELVWTYDADEEARLRDLLAAVEQSWPALRRKNAANSQFARMSFLIDMAITIKTWRGLAVKRAIDRGYITIDCAERLAVALAEFAKANGAEPTLAYLQLVNACTGRLRLSEDEAKNSASPSQSSTSPQPSSGTEASEQDGSFPAPASSKKTPENA